MPKLKTKSSVKKRFKLSAKGKVISAMSGKRHGMIKRTPKQIRQKRGTDPLEAPDAKIAKGWMPYGVGGRRLKSVRKNAEAKSEG